MYAASTRRPTLHVGQPRAPARAPPLPAAGHHPIALAGGRHGHDRRPSGQVGRGAASCSREEAGPEHRPVKRQLSRLLDFDTDANPARMVDNASVDRARDLPRFPPGRWQALLRQHDGSQGQRPLAMETAKTASATRSSATCCCRPMTSTTCRDARLRAPDRRHPTSGAISPPALTSSARSWGRPAWGLTFPLITKADGTKFGKTEDGRRVARSEEDEPVQVLPVLRSTRRTALVVAYLKMFTSPLPRRDRGAGSDSTPRTQAHGQAHKALAQGRD